MTLTRLDVFAARDDAAGDDVVRKARHRIQRRALLLHARFGFVNRSSGFAGASVPEQKAHLAGYSAAVNECLSAVTALRELVTHAAHGDPTAHAKHLAEHNVIREGHWVCRGIEGEFRNNLVLEAHGHNHLQIGKARVHHNIFARGSRTPDRLGTPVKIPAVSSDIAILDHR